MDDHQPIPPIVESNFKVTPSRIELNNEWRWNARFMSIVSWCSDSDSVTGRIHSKTAMDATGMQSTSSPGDMHLSRYALQHIFVVYFEAMVPECSERIMFPLPRARIPSSPKPIVMKRINPAVASVGVYIGGGTSVWA